MVFAFALNLQPQIPAAALKKMTAVLPVVRDEVKVISRHVERSRILWRPKPHERSRDVLKIEHRLNRRRLHERHSLFHLVDGSRAHVIKLPVDPQRIKQVVGIPEAIESGCQMTQVGALVHHDSCVQRKMRDHGEGGRTSSPTGRTEPSERI